MSGPAGNTLDIQSKDVIKLILQFCQENALLSTLTALQNETGVNLNTIQHRDTFLDDVKQGRWDKVLMELAHVKLSPASLVDLYEQIIVEMLDMGELELAKSLLRKSEAMNHLRLNNIDRYLRLEHYLQRGSVDLRDFYDAGVSTDKRRAQLATLLGKEIQSVEPSRLMSLLAQALKWQQYQGIVAPGADYDLFRGDSVLSSSSAASEEEDIPTTLDRTIKFQDKNYPECCRFSPDAQYLVTGSVDGFIEVWNYSTGKLATNLPYQSNDDFMMHDKTILCLNFSRDGEYLASGSIDGHIKVWHIRTGKCLRKFEPAHPQGVTCLYFSKNATQVLSGSFDGTLKIHGLKSGKSLKVFRGHNSFVNDCFFTESEDRVVSCSSDATVRVWDAKSAECLQTLRPTQSVRIKDISVRGVIGMRNNPDLVLICNASPIICIMSIRTQTITKQFTLDNNKNFLCCTLSPKQTYLYAVSEDNILHCFDVDKGTHLQSMELHPKEVISIMHHPNRNVLASISTDCTLRIWKSINKV
ncbi:hypothetical protein SAMD00019534_065140 [Acytostelium subglobosum LB1]|uniref:hypothetical protein n=1 Tax=Acytostelium subglobosum LB1 TaxID=1410327 RepID=UPI000644C960|nr:hypothetical protein SAMD00019534_065140 [Acytostelium subglobosum LB1]GAM23339.1 hypothetical protein SAMD00019534_065140 [Acytostelium subglobosum LB1]|eukprot:XP_012753788.1 hypothetical protein SAMD00019534_065140 [Acytostelium subglobosum LB1]